MDRAAELPDRRQYEKRGIAIKAQTMGREPSEQELETIQKEFSQKYGEGWKVDMIYPGALITEAEGSGFVDGHMVIFKRRRQLRDE